MATLNRFQIYSQGENTITNNVLLALATLYDLSPAYYQEIIVALSDEGSYTVSPLFNQQIGNRGNGIIDGHIRILPSTIVIETKVARLEDKDKLLKYVESFDKKQTNILLHLSKDVYPAGKISDIRRCIKEGEFPKAKFESITYDDLVSQLLALSEQHPYDIELRKLAEEFQDYCVRMALVDQGKHVLRAMACGQSFNLNVKHKFYFDLADRGYSDFQYLGIYNQKAVRYIGEVANNIEADYVDGELDIKSSTFPVNKEQQLRLVEAIQDSIDSGWDNVAIGHRFFLLKDFTKTDFRKTSKGGIFRVRYFKLAEVLDEQDLAGLKLIADRLSRITWE